MPATPRENATRAMTTLTRAELVMLRAIREADQDHGGLSGDELTEDERAICDALVERGLAAVLS